MAAISNNSISDAATVKARGIRPGAQDRTERMSGLAKGLAIIEAFDGQRALTVSGAAKVSGTSRAAARRCLLTLEELGYVTFDGKSYQPMPRMLRLGCGAQLPLPQVAQPIIEKARNEFNESVSVAVLDGDDVMFVARAEAERIVLTGVKVGARLPAYCSASGRVLLSGFVDGRAAEIVRRSRRVRRTPKTLIDPDAIQDRIRLVRRNGYAITDEELELGMLSMALPVTDSAGHIRAAISVSAFSARVTADQMVKVFLPVMKRYAAILGKSL
jgi:IclR family transcriptional regulator, pca regulon regulatory protein